MGLPSAPFEIICYISYNLFPIFPGDAPVIAYNTLSSVNGYADPQQGGQMGKSVRSGGVCVCVCMSEGGRQCSHSLCRLAREHDGPLAQKYIYIVCFIMISGHVLEELMYLIDRHARVADILLWKHNGHTLMLVFSP